MAFPTLVQSKPINNGTPTSATISGTFTSAPASGNLIGMVFAGDKNTGALTMSGTGWTVEVQLLSASVSLYVAWKVSDGTETTISGTTATAPGSGDTGWIFELNQSGAAAWGVVAKATNITNEATATTTSTGTSGNATYDGYGIAAVAVDSALSIPNGGSWTNSFVAAYDAPSTGFSDGGQAGIHVGTKNITAGTTASSTWTTTGGSADQLSAAVVAFGRLGAAGPSAPTVNAGADVPMDVDGTFLRTATENDNGSAITSRSWTIQSGPAGTGTTIGTAAALSWTPTVSGTYTLRYSSTNSVGTGTDDVVVTVSSPTRSISQQWVGIDSVAVKTSSTVAGEQVRIAFSASSGMTSPIYSSPLQTPDTAGVSKHTIPAIVPGVTYYYQAEVGGGLVGSPQAMKTLPGTSPQSFSFAFGSCRDHGLGEGPTPNPVSFVNAKSRGINFFLEIGDFHYRDITTNDQAAFQAAYDEFYTRSNIAAMLAEIPTMYVWDDHDFGGDNSNTNTASKPAAQAVYRNRVPHSTLPSATGGIYQTFVVGRVRIIMLDTRSFRSPVGNTDNSSKTMLGTEQKTWFKSLLDNATTPYTVVISSVGWVGGTESGQDHWGLYQTERTEIGGWITSNTAKTKVVFLCGDAHMLAIDNGTNAVAGTPVYHGSALNEIGTFKGGPYSGGSLQGTNQFGLVEVTDDGTNMTLKFSGVKSDNTVWNTHQTSLTAPSGGSGVEPGRMLLLL